MVWMTSKDSPDTGDSAKMDMLGDDDSNNRVESANNKIYFYSEVVRPKILTLNKKIVQLNVSLKNQVNSLGLSEPQANIKLHINSYGGSVFAGFAAADYIKSSDIPVTSIIDGCAASAATMMSIVAEERYMRETSFMLIHQLSAGSWGKFEELRDDMTNNELLMKTIKEIYAKYTKIPRKKLAQLLQRDLWWNAQTCLEYGLIDDII
jgi:ATP-dependent Clp endopeptidase proteolytic subunit ClpP|tara:strand:+ start:1706 stop:2326 length:621 start_codon:yes stop_codon:yes gene_type:complete